MAKNMIEGEPIKPKVESPEIEIEVTSGETYLATYYNTCLYFFPFYPQLDHIFIQGDLEGNGILIYNNGDAMKYMFSKSYPSVVNPIPPQSEFDSYLEYADSKLGDDLNSL